MRVNKANQARRIESMIRQFHLYSDAEEILDRVFYHFSRLHGIGVAVDENDHRNRYVFMKYPYRENEDWSPLSSSHEGCCHMDDFTFVKPCTTKGIKRENIMYILSHVERKLNLPHWESYLEEEQEKNHHDELDAITCVLAPRACGKSNQMFQKSLEYIRTDVESIRKMDANLAKSLLNSRFGLKNAPINWSIKKVIFHDPATIIYWNDGTKTVVKVQDGEQFDPEKGMAMAICKKANCNDSSYYEAFKEFLPKETELSTLDKVLREFTKGRGYKLVRGQDRFHIRDLANNREFVVFYDATLQGVKGVKLMLDLVRWGEEGNKSPLDPNKRCEQRKNEVTCETCKNNLLGPGYEPCASCDDNCSNWEGKE